MGMAVTGGVPTRPFGRHGEPVSIIGVGGGHLSRSSVSEADAVHIIQTAIGEGVTFLDTAWDYADGASETRFGKAVQDRRDQVFLMTKVCARDRATAQQQLDESLRRLQVDHLDLWQIHECNYDNDPEWVFEPGGVIEAAMAAKESGKTRYVGFTGHKSPHILLRMLAMDFEWDACQMPVNVMDSLFRSFGQQVLPELTRRGVACIGMKSLGGDGQFVREAGLSAEVCRRYALTQPITTLSCGICTLDDLHQDLAIARGFQPMNAAEQERLRGQVRREATDGRYEWFKTTTFFDGPYHRDQHGFPAHAAVRR